MSQHLVYQLYCDKCDKLREFFWSMKKPPEEQLESLRRSAGRVGWTFVSGPQRVEIYCPECSKEDNDVG